MEFVKEIKFNNRNPQNISLLKTLDNLSANPTTIVEKGEKFFRCRVVNNDLDKVDVDKNFKGYNEKGSFVTPREKASDMRANYRFIPYLYVASSEKIAMLETRPKDVSLVSVANIVVCEELTLFDLRKTKELSDHSRNVKDNFLIDLAELYSKPVDTNDDQIDYVPTQYIAEYIKNLDYDGIIYPSTKGKDKYKDYNIVIFNYEKCRAKSSKLKIFKKGEV